jgi:hypothetical protein
VTDRIIKGNSEKNALKANAPAHWAPSICENFLTARQSIAQTRRVSRLSRLDLITGTDARGRIVLEAIIDGGLGNDSFIRCFVGFKVIA